MKTHHFLIVPFVLVAMFGCKSKERATSPVTLTARGRVRVLVKIGGLATIADAGTANENARKTVVLAMHTGHSAAILVQKDNLVSTTGFTQVKDSRGVLTNWYAYPLNGVQIEFASGPNWDGGTTVAFSNDGDASNATLPTIGTGGNATSLHWIPRMSFVLGTLPIVKDAYFKQEPLNTDVAARVPLRGGRLESTLKAPYYLWQFRDNAGTYKQIQVLAEELHYIFDVTATPFGVYGRNFAVGGATPGNPAKLFEIQPFGGATQIEIRLVNLPPNEFIISVLDQKTWKVGDTYKHFPMHCKTLQNSPCDGYVPTVIGQKEPGSGPASVEVYCGPDQLP